MSDARVFQVTVRILNRTLTETLLNRESPEHQEFSRQVLHEVKPSVGTMSFRRRDSHEPGSPLSTFSVTVAQVHVPIATGTQPKSHSNYSTLTPPIYGGLNLDWGPNRL